MNWVSIPAFALFLFFAPFQSALAASAKVSGGFGCDRKSEGAVCFTDGCVCGFLLSIDGEIDFTTVDKVKALFDVRRAHKGEANEGFSINSRGGNVAAAMAIGRMFRKERAWLSVSGDCVSACVFVLAGAIERITNSGRVGIHRPYGMTIDKSLPAEKVGDTYRAILQQLRAYLREMNVDERLADDMLRAEPEKVHYLTQAELAGYRLSGIDRSELETRAVENEIRDVQEAARLGLDRREYTRRKMLGDALCSALPWRESATCKQKILRTGQRD